MGVIVRERDTQFYREGLLPRSRRWLVVIFAVSIAVRAGVALYLGESVQMPRPASDQVSYHNLAVRLVEGHGYSFATAWYPFTAAETPTAHWSFLYTACLAAVYALFGPNPLAARLVQAVLGGILQPWLAYRLARKMWPHKGRVALLAAGLTAIYAYFALHAAMLMTETFFIVCVIWSLEAALRLCDTWSAHEGAPRRVAAELGLSLGLAALMRQSILPWVPVLFLALLLAPSGRPAATRCRSLVVAGAVLLACILPWTIRNYRVYGGFLLLNSNTGYAMYSAQHPMHGTAFQEFAAAPIPDGLRGLNEAQMDRELLRCGIRFVREDPRRYVLLSLSRLRAYFEFWPTPDTTLLHNLGRVGSYGLYLPFMLFGLYLSLRRRMWAAGRWLVLLFMVFYSFMHVLTWAMVRYRLPVDAAAMPLAALAVEDLWSRLLRAPAGVCIIGWSAFAHRSAHRGRGRL